MFSLMLFVMRGVPLVQNLSLEEIGRWEASAVLSRQGATPPSLAPDLSIGIPPAEMRDPLAAQKLTHSARVVLERRYLRKDDLGVVIESPGEMFRRVAKAVAAP